MQFTFNRVDLTASGENPTDRVMRSNVSEVWYVPFTPLVFDKTAEWRHYKREQLVLIPLFAYLAPDRPVDAMGFAFQLGVNAVAQLGQRKIKRLHLSLGEPISQVTDASNQPAWSFWLGVGAVFE